MEGFRSKMGWERPAPSYVLKSHLSRTDWDKAMALGRESDVVIMGTAPEVLIEERLKLNKLTFRYSERPLKEGRWKVLVPHLAYKFYHNHFRNRHKELYILAAGAYCSSDYHFLKSYEGKCYKFGYFPEIVKKSFEELSKLKSGNKPMKVLWAGRFLKLKRPDLMVRAAATLKKQGMDFSLEFVGDGTELKGIKDMIDNEGLKDCTEFKGFLSPEDTRREMEGADIFVMTSNNLEGWGSVIYEALSAGCAVVASHAAGATPFLIEDGKNGFIFRSGDLPMLTEKLGTLLKNRELSEKMGEAAYRNMQDSWNPRVAAERLIALSESKLSGESLVYESGPLSPCPLLYMGAFGESLK